MTTIADEIAFGTSGLRGTASGFSHQVVRAYVQAFLREIAGDAGADVLFLGMDFRASSPDIAKMVATAAEAAGWQVTNAGVLPTPAIAAYALARHCPAIMVTGSHIPPSYNGLKFYRRDGELLKSDEAPMRELAEQIFNNEVELPFDERPIREMSPSDPAPMAAYVDRYLDAFGPDALKGMRIGVDQHSAAGRDVLVELLEKLGARCVPYNRAEVFVAVDTEAVDDERLAAASTLLKSEDLHAIVSTDGDGDRPLVLDETGNQIGGDVLGALTSRALAIATVVTPLTSTSAIEQSGWFEHVERTRIGSPYVVAAMAAARKGPVAGFEPNGGFLLGDDIVLPGGKLAALPTRDAVLPIIAVLWEANRLAQPLSTLARALPPRFARADRIPHVLQSVSSVLLTQLLNSSTARAALDVSIENPAAIDITDGIRFTRADGTIVHFRPSGNAPELRCYVEADSAQGAHQMLQHFIAALRVRVDQSGNPDQSENSA